jgi:tetratricopeptide (TPR) repeat protein
MIAGLVSLQVVGSLALCLAEIPEPLRPCVEQASLGALDDGYACLVMQSARADLTDEATAVLEAAIGRDPEDGSAMFALAKLYERRGDPRTRATYEVALTPLSRWDASIERQVKARVSYAAWLGRNGEFDRSEAEFERAVDDAEASGSMPAIALSLTRQAANWAMRKHNVAQAEAQLRWVEATLGDELEPPERTELHAYLGAVAFNTHRPEAAATAFARAVEEYRGLGHTLNEARALYNLGVAQSVATLRSGGAELDTAAQTFRRALELAEELGQPVMADSNRSGLAGCMIPTEQGRPLLETCVSHDPERAPSVWSQCAHHLMVRLPPSDLPRVEELLQRTLAIAVEQDDVVEVGFIAGSGALALRQAGHLRRATALAMLQLAAVETLRARQTDDLSRARVLADDAAPYYAASGALLRLPDDPAALDLAVNIMERLRAQSDLLLQPGTRSSASNTASALLQTWDGWNSSPPWTDLLDPQFPIVSDVQSVLRPNEAVLSLQLDERRDPLGFERGGSWLTVITSARVDVHPLADHRDLSPRVEAFIGMFFGGQQATPAASASLAAALLPGLPASADTLYVVPDAALHRLPFGALRGSDGQPLAMRYQISVLPSLSFLIDRRSSSSATDHSASLVLGDPEISEAAQARDRSAQPLFSGHDRHARLPRLPAARSEAMAVADRLGPPVSARIGMAATLDGLGDRPPAILHLATHALVDIDHPERGGIVIAPGGGNDGVLQTEAIAALALEHSVVMLSACSSAGGPTYRGEGVMGLARAFFRAGAQTVVATLWPVADAEASAFFIDVYAHLAEGLSVAEAVTATQREWIEAERSPQTWAAIVVLGDGDIRPLRPRNHGWPWWLLGGVLAAVGIAVAVTRGRRT